MKTVPVSLIITHYNQPELCREAVESVLESNPMPQEIIIVDDGSTKDSLEKLRAQLIRFPELILVEQKNLGVSAARNHGAMRALQPFISNLDGDDKVFDPRKFGFEFNILKENPSSIAASSYKRVDIARFITEEVRVPAPSLSREEALRLVATREWIPRDPMYSKSLFERAGGFDPSRSLFEDWDFKLRLINCSDGIIDSMCGGTEYFIRGGGLSSRPKYSIEAALRSVAWKNRALLKEVGVDYRLPLSEFLIRLVYSFDRHIGQRLRLVSRRS